MFFDGVERRTAVKVGIVLISPHKYVILKGYSLNEPCTNNTTKYNALIIGLYIAQQLGLKYLEAYEDSKLIVNPMTAEYEMKHEDFIPYFDAAIKLPSEFENFYISHIPKY